MVSGQECVGGYCIIYGCLYYVMYLFLFKWYLGCQLKTTKVSSMPHQLLYVRKITTNDKWLWNHGNKFNSMAN